MKDRILFIVAAVVAIVVGVLVFLYGNTGTSTPSSASPSLAGYDQASAVSSVPFTLLVSGSRSKVDSRVNYFITSSDQLNELWKMIDTTSTTPDVDFSKDAVIAVFAGQQPTAGYAIRVSKVVDSSSRLVSITIAKPDGDCMTGQSLTAPYEIVVVPITALPLAHEDLSVTTKCN
ncbi:MAG: protease complex subunit PrcB family protein [Patescibacteria group bacterium]